MASLKEIMRLATVMVIAALASNSALADDRSAVDEEAVYTLYRSSSVTGGEKWRLHVATFDAVAGPEYNRDNCEIAKQLFQGQSGVKVTYWCERGFFSEK